MWDPLLRRELERCTLVHAQVIDGQPAVYCILDPPRYAVGEKAYATAQSNTVALFNQLPHATVALQDDLWEDYRSVRSLGISRAIAQAKEPPIVMDIEKGFARAQFEALKSHAVERMSLATPFFTSILAAFDALASREHSAFATIRHLRGDFRERKISQATYVRQLARVAESQRVSVPLEIVLAARGTELTSRLHAVSFEQRKLEEEITARVQAHAFSPHTTVELYLYVLENHHGHDPEYAETIRACRMLLEEPEPLVDDGMVREVAAAVSSGMGDFLGPGIRIDPDEQHRPHRGHGEVVSRLIELAPLLDIDVNRYPALQLYLRHTQSMHRLTGLRASGLALGMAEAMRRLETDILFAVAKDDREQAMVALLPLMEVLSELRFFRIEYGDEAREALAGFSAVDLCHRLDDLGAKLPAQMHTDAQAVETWIADVVELHEETVRRGKLLAANLLHEIESRQLDSILLVCDAYLYDVVVGELGTAVSYSLLLPDFSVD
jgi:hypothetical protein